MVNSTNILVPPDVLIDILANTSLCNTGFRLVKRESNPYSDTFPSEIITLRLESGAHVRLLCKYYDGTIYRDLGHGHRGGLQYEAEVYRRILTILNDLGVSLPLYYGAHTDQHSHATVLVLGYIDAATPVHKSTQWLLRMEAAARWLGRFHNSMTEDILKKGRRFLIQYDRQYYAGWARRAYLYTGSSHKRFPWVPIACDFFEDSIESLLQLPQTVIHGKFHPKEVLISGDGIYPVDWESAAIGVGEIDLAMFVYGWPARHTERWASAYEDARWPAGAPYDFGRTFDFARLYVQMRWLGDTLEWTEKEAKTPEPFQALCTLMERFNQY